MLGYLDLLKLALCELVSTRSMQAYRRPDDVVEPKLIDSHQVPDRVEGRDWPLCALTMIGMERLNSLQATVEAVVSDDIPGDLIEAGTWRGGAAMLMRATLDCLNGWSSKGSDRTVFVADTFDGFEPADGMLSQFDHLRVPLEEVKASFERLRLSEGVEFVPGRVEHTLRDLPGPWSLIRLDTDTYHAITASLEALYPALSPGGFVIVDDYSCIEPVRRATTDFRNRVCTVEPLELLDWNCARWRKA